MRVGLQDLSSSLLGHALVIGALGVFVLRQPTLEILPVEILAPVEVEPQARTVTELQARTVIEPEARDVTEASLQVDSRLLLAPMIPRNEPADFWVNAPAPRVKAKLTLKAATPLKTKTPMVAHDSPGAKPEAPAAARTLLKSKDETPRLQIATPIQKTEQSLAQYLKDLLALVAAKKRYPRASVLHEEEGTALMRVMIRPDGTLFNPSVFRSSGFQRLDQAALQVFSELQRMPPPPGSAGLSLKIPIQFKLD